MVYLELPKLDPLKYTIKIADLNDDVLPVLRAGIEQSPFKIFPITDDQLRATIKDYVTNIQSKILLLLCYEGKPVGLLMGLAGYSHPMLVNIKVAMEILWYVEPEYRGKYSLRLVDAFEYWAEKVMGVDVLTMGSLADGKDLDVLYRRRGFKHVENSYIKDLRK